MHLLQVMQVYVELTGDFDGVEIVEGKVQGKCWDRGLPSRIRTVELEAGSAQMSEHVFPRVCS